MSDFEQWAENDDYAMNLSLERDEDGRYCDIHIENMLRGWQAAIASMQGEAKFVGLALQYGNDKTATVFDADIVPIGTRLFINAPDSAARIAEQDARIKELEQQLEVARIKADKYDAINTPEIDEFLSAVHNEALHRRERWGSEHDAGKTDADWFWLVGHLASKALLKTEKSVHHIITTAAALLNWHAAKVGAHNLMRPGIGPDKQPPKPSEPIDAAIRQNGGAE